MRISKINSNQTNREDLKTDRNLTDELRWGEKYCGLEIVILSLDSRDLSRSLTGSGAVQYGTGEKTQREINKRIVMHGTGGKEGLEFVEPI